VQTGDGKIVPFGGWKEIKKSKKRGINFSTLRGMERDKEKKRKRNLYLVQTGDGKNLYLVQTGDGKNLYLVQTGDGKNL
jgi:hypothetical protein